MQKLNSKPGLSGDGAALVVALLVVSALALVTGCSTLTGWFTTAVQKVQVEVGKHGAGNYAVTLTKDGQPILTETWRCDAGPDGKLAGCHALTTSAALPQ